MNLLDARQDIVDALGEVEGVTGYDRPPATLRPGDAWPRPVGIERDGDTGQFVVTWSVVVLLPPDQGAAIERLEDLVPDLDAALRSVAYVQTYTPVSYPNASGAAQPALEITMIRE